MLILLRLPGSCRAFPPITKVPAAGRWMAG
jgi:hypothetical protein